ncbi:hypothetical protein C731_1817 [Mycolicibacterium hassiacum DSM 44199]|mgnify:CR=1 FL=1|uniref:Uncharacterized protein n=1 Tax=Mycolicibacterium hassiacum (strain DSM 44199 / CIP 105218 / JCM 12690 / 3849) TaxID=1122247 RepID=K5BFM9_MYCHD|nr:hypothetical protein [Mycolicibacterium hassiacum]EKF24057.1 hypothetical protein C731_1817 [Mycolicibacterium hassiacum DSM 44199]MDA4085193.1 hypothetical protein [Mycolicibacterium hassiacum DSM 44199]VCT90703.1 hypothetical protein MHAS_02412 [Mycolicibacterium hassiacum DSM 44199]
MQSFGGAHRMGHPAADVPALLLVAALLWGRRWRPASAAQPAGTQ